MISTTSLVTITALATAIAAPIAAGSPQPAQVRRSANAIAGRYIVALAGNDDSAAVGLEVSGAFRGRLRAVYRAALRGFAIELPEAAARRLAADPRVAYIEEDAVITLANVTQFSPPWGLDRIDQRSLPLTTQYAYARDGSGVHVHVVDTGIRISHADFGGRAFIAADYVDDDNDGDPADLANDDPDPSRPDGVDCHGHGTHVAGTIGGITYGVAKNVTLWAHRVFNCSAVGSTSDLLAAIDAITASAQRPAIANLSLGGAVSPLLDYAVQQSIAAGVTYLIAAGNANVDASNYSPARVPEAITVGATGSNDARASFSNYGPVLDLFAPGVSIRSAGIASDTAYATMSGTSMAAPHAAGVAALYLQSAPGAGPAEVRDALVGAATPGVVTVPGTGSPNLLLYSNVVPVTPPVVTLLTPVGGEKLFTNAPYEIRWTASDDDGLAAIDVQLSLDSGVTYNAIPGCAALAGSATSCTWSSPGPVSTTARVRVLARDALGTMASNASKASFSIVTGSPVVTVTAPNTLVDWGRGSTQQIKWTHNLGAASWVRIELSRDGGATFPEIVADGLKNTASTSGLFNWVVSGPNVTAGAVIRVSWTAGPASDASNAAFTIADPYIKLTAPTATGNWGYGTQQKPAWTTNLSSFATVDVLLSADGGSTFTTLLASGVPASARAATVTTPALAAPIASARLRVVWTNPPEGSAAAGVNPANFKLEPPFVRLTAPNGGETWTSGTSPLVKWVHNLSSLESVSLQLSTDDGASYPVTLLPATPSDGSQAVAVDAGWLTGLARVKIAWLRDGAVSDSSDKAFLIQ